MGLAVTAPRNRRIKRGKKTPGKWKPRDSNRTFLIKVTMREGVLDKGKVNNTLGCFLGT